MLGTATKLKTPRNISLTGDITGSASFDGSNNVTINADMANVAVLTGTIKLKPSSDAGTTYAQTVWNINYPSGFNKDNCIVLSYGGKFAGEGFTYGYVENASSSVAAVGGSVSRTVTLNSSNIQAQAWNISHLEKEFSYKIVLMKI